MIPKPTGSSTKQLTKTWPTRISRGFFFLPRSYLIPPLLCALIFANLSSWTFTILFRNQPSSETYIRELMRLYSWSNAVIFLKLCSEVIFLKYCSCIHHPIVFRRVLFHRLCKHRPWGWGIMDFKTLHALTQGVGSLRYHGCEDCASPDQGGGIFEISWMSTLCKHRPKVGSLRYHGCENCVSPDQRSGNFKISWMWSLCTHWPRGWDLWDVMDVKTLHALTQGVRSLRYHGCEDCVSPNQGGGIFGI